MTVDDIIKIAKSHRAYINIQIMPKGDVSIVVHKNGIGTAKTLENRQIRTSPFDLVEETVKRMVRIL